MTMVFMIAGSVTPLILRGWATGVFFRRSRNRGRLFPPPSYRAVRLAMPTAPPFQTSAEAVIAELRSDARLGLSEAEARQRLERDGRNELTAEEPVPGWRKFLAQFTDVLVILLLIATAISAALWLYERESALPYEALAIFTIVLLNAILGYVQESRAEAAVAALRAIAAAEATVIRDGARRLARGGELAPGDIILVEEGDPTPADARLIQSTALQTAEAALTGESL